MSVTKLVSQNARCFPGRMMAHINLAGLKPLLQIFIDRLVGHFAEQSQIRHANLLLLGSFKGGLSDLGLSRSPAISSPALGIIACVSGAPRVSLRIGGQHRMYSTTRKGYRPSCQNVVPQGGQKTVALRCSRVKPGASSNEPNPLSTTGRNQQKPRCDWFDESKVKIGCGRGVWQRV